MNISYVLLILVSYCSLSAFGMRLLRTSSSSKEKSDLVRIKIQNLATKYVKQYNALPKQVVFKELNDAISKWDDHKAETQQYISTVLDEMVRFGNEYVENLNEIVKKVNTARDNSFQKKLDQVTEVSAIENNNVFKELMNMISEKNDWKTTRNLLKSLGKISDPRKDVSVIVSSDENNDTMHDQFVNNVITSYNKMVQEKLREMNKNIENQQHTIFSNDQNIILELEDMISDTTTLELYTQRMISDTWRHLVQKGEQNLVTLNQQYENSDEKYNESVQEILGNVIATYFNEYKEYIPSDYKIFQKIDKTISEANKLKTNDSILAILYEIDNVDPEDEEERDKLIKKVGIVNNTITMKKLSKISKECNENIPTSKYSINSILNELDEMILDVEIYDLKTKNVLAETLQCVVQLVKENHKQGEKLIKNSNAFISKEVAKKLIEIQIIYSKTQTALSDDDPVFQQLDNMISELNEPEINLDILSALEKMANLNSESVIKRNKLIKKVEKCYNESIEIKLKEMEVRARDAHYSTDLMAAILQELDTLISEYNSIPVNLHILKILDNLNFKLDDHNSETIRYSLINKLGSFINKTVEAKFEEISQKYWGTKRFDLLLPSDEIFHDLETINTEMNIPRLGGELKTLLVEMSSKCIGETCEKIARLLEKNILCLNQLAQREIKKILRKLKKDDRIHPDDPVFMELKSLIAGINIFKVDTIQLIFEALHNLNSMDGRSVHQRELLIAGARSKYTNFIGNKLSGMEMLFKNNPMLMLEDIEVLIVDINDLETNELILHSLLSMEISEEDIIKKRDELIDKVKEKNENYAMKVLWEAIMRLDDRKVHFVGLDYDEFTELGKVISSMNNLKLETQQHIIEGLLIIGKSASNRDELIKKWQEECKDEELKEKYAKKIAEHFAKPVDSREVLDQSPEGGPAHQPRRAIERYNPQLEAPYH